MEMEDEAPGAEPERIIIVGLFVRRLIFSRFQERFAVRILNFVFFRRDHGAGDEIMSVGLADVWRCREHAVLVNPRAATWARGVAWPRDARAAGQLCIGEACVIAG